MVYTEALSQLIFLSGPVAECLTPKPCRSDLSGWVFGCENLTPGPFSQLQFWVGLKAGGWNGLHNSLVATTCLGVSVAVNDLHSGFLALNFLGKSVAEWLTPKPRRNNLSGVVFG